MSYIRTKTITLDGAEFRIAPLTIEQVEELIAPVSEQQNGEELLESARLTVCVGLNNAMTHAEAAEFGLWVPSAKDAESAATYAWKRAANIFDIEPPHGNKYRVLLRKIDHVTFHRLQDEVLSFSGLRHAEDTLGESGAAAPTAAA